MEFKKFVIVVDDHEQICYSFEIKVIRVIGIIEYLLIAHYVDSSGESDEFCLDSFKTAEEAYAYVDSLPEVEV